MCPLRIILIFLSATLAGFFLLRNLKSQPKFTDSDTDVAAADDSTLSESSPSSSSSSATYVDRSSSKVCGALVSGFWTFVDMASGRYLWRNLVSSSSSSSKKTN